ncbi:probable indole-3-pyruvate monooxygenase YUCCA4 [Phalaenopsis equestris]|uniref:probable indole-3-pyruvate monooxygenase YUCCA4 n=1 Tax=Phalaenopsis equestris TaxID=78828 RepID=UPI0009E1AA45|nr:probable indole-3-pyruvate monooxygenase YUCCA4 [Phalaenopsis equestris]
MTTTAADDDGGLTASSATPSTSLTFIPGPIIVGAGPSGLATAASLHLLSIPSVIIERSDGIAHLWRHNSYDRLSLHLPKQFCELPHLHFPSHFPIYPSKSDFISYLLTYVDHFGLRPNFHCTATAARFNEEDSLWHVEAVRRSPEREEEEVVELVSPWLVVATGENAEPVVPEMKGKERFKGGVLHSSEYRNGVDCKGKRVLVVGCGNSGMEMCLDLCEFGAVPFLSVRSGVHVLPRDLLGISTFGLAMKLLKLLPVRLVDRILLLLARMAIGDTEKYGLKRPMKGPLELKNSTGKTPVLDVGAFKLIKKGRTKVVSEVESLTRDGAKFADGREMAFDSVIFATGYRSNVPLWLKDCDFFSADGKPKLPFPNGWKGENGLYCVGFTGRGLLGAGIDAQKVALDIADSWKKTSSIKNQ